MSIFRGTIRIIANTNSFYKQTFVPQSKIHRWVMPTLKELKRRQTKLGPQSPINRTEFIEWNYSAELYAFAKRLHESFDQNLLQQAFVHRSYIVKEELKQQELGIEQPETNLKDNSELALSGERLIGDYVEVFVGSQLPGFPIEGVRAVRDYLLSDDILSTVSKHLGTTELILSAEFPVEPKTLATTLKAVIGALSGTHGQNQAYDFVRDFICTQLNQKDVNDLWQIERPFQMLQEICQKNNFGEPEPRLLGTAGRNTLLSTYHVGIYCNKKLIDSGFGESVAVAQEVAVLKSLRKLFGTDNHKPFDFKVNVTDVFKLYNQRRQQING